MATPGARIAAEVLMRVAQTSAFANLALDAALRQAGALEPREVALAERADVRSLRCNSSSTVRWRRTATAALDEPRRFRLRVALRLGRLRAPPPPEVPAHAVVNEAVEVAKELKAGRAAGFVNAVLRKALGDAGAHRRRRRVRSIPSAMSPRSRPTPAGWSSAGRAGWGLPRRRSWLRRISNKPRRRCECTRRATPQARRRKALQSPHRLRPGKYSPTR